jgi:uncharacterized membrane protein (UPF0182 family)
VFPSLFTDGKEMPDFLRAHVRYPELLFRAQAAIYSMYHVENEQVFYNREDVWTVAQQGRSQQGQGSADVIESYFVLAGLPGETRQEFISILPFTPANRNNLIGWLAGRSDGDKYGTLRAYRFPKSRFVDGPLQIQARIDQDPQLSSQLTLWNQQGSTVIRGNLIVMPLEDTLLFVEPIYLQAERSPMPELRIVVLATQIASLMRLDSPKRSLNCWPAPHRIRRRRRRLGPQRRLQRLPLRRLTFAHWSNAPIRR